MRPSLNISRVFIGIFMLVYTSGIAQKLSVSKLLAESQDIIKDKKQLHCDLKYQLYPSALSNNVLQEYKGEVIKNNDNYYIQIKNTLFLSDIISGNHIKLNKDQKLIQFSKVKNQVSNSSVFDQIDLLIKQFKLQAISSKGAHWVCELKADVISQLPYSKVEIYVDKKTKLLTKQVLFLSMQESFKNKEGKLEIGNPRLEISITNYKFNLTKDEEQLTEFSQYVKVNGNKKHPVGAYSNFKIVTN